MDEEIAFGNYIPVYKEPGAPGRKTPETIIPEKCPECGCTKYAVHYTAPPGFECEGCGCAWSEEDGIPVNGVVKAKQTIHSHGRKREIGIESCARDLGKEPKDFLLLKNKKSFDKVRVQLTHLPTGKFVEMEVDIPFDEKKVIMKLIKKLSSGGGDA